MNGCYLRENREVAQRAKKKKQQGKEKEGFRKRTGMNRKSGAISKRKGERGREKHSLEVPWERTRKKDEGKREANDKKKRQRSPWVKKKGIDLLKNVFARSVREKN